MICRFVTPEQVAVSKVMESEVPAALSFETLIGVEPADPSGTAGGGVLASTDPVWPAKLVGELTATTRSTELQELALLQTKEWIPSVGSWAALKIMEGQPVQANVSLTVEKNGTDPAGKV